MQAILLSLEFNFIIQIVYLYCKGFFPLTYLHSTRTGSEQIGSEIINIHRFNVLEKCHPEVKKFLKKFRP